LVYPGREGASGFVGGISNHQTKRKTYDDSMFDLSKIDQSKCQGFSIENFENEKMYENFPFQLLCSPIYNLKFVFENSKLHANSCFKNNYLCPLGQDANKECSDLKYDTDLNKIIMRMPEVKKHTNYEFMNHRQAVETIRHYAHLNQESHLHELNNRRTIISLRNKISLYQRFTVLLSNNDIPRVHVLLNTCLKRNCGISGIIEKLKAAIEGHYKSKKWDQDEFDIGILVMNIAGPSLLKCFSNRNQLPSSAMMYKVCRQNVELEYVLNNCRYFEKPISCNIKYFFENQEGFFSLKMDEIAITPCASYHRKSNQIIGFCANDSPRLDTMEFNHWDDFLEIKNAFANGEIHLAKEALFFSIGKISHRDSVPKPLCILPICSHKNTNQQLQIMKIIIKAFEKLSPHGVLVNVASDGDTSRSSLFLSERVDNKENFACVHRFKYVVARAALILGLFVFLVVFYSVSKQYVFFYERFV